MYYMKYFVIFMVLSNLLVYGCTKKTIIPNTNLDGQDVNIKIEEMNTDVKHINTKTFYVAPHNGLILRTEPSLSGARIRVLQQYTKLTVIDMSFRKETIDGIRDYWYKVDVNGESGWVFGGYLVSSINANTVIERTIEEQYVIELSNGQKIDFRKNSGVYDIDNIMIYDKTDRTSNYFEMQGGFAYFYKLDDNDDWLYIRMVDAERYNKNGFVSIYDISEESFYHKYMDEMREAEYKIVKEHKNFKRYGPIFIIYYEYNTIKFGDSFTGELGCQDYIIDYYHEYDEVLIATSFVDVYKLSIFNLKFNQYICEDIGYPFFSPSRNYIISLYPSIYDKQGSILRVYSRKNNTYEKVYETETKYRIDTVSWINEEEAKINYGDDGSLTVRINNYEIEIYN